MAELNYAASKQASDPATSAGAVPDREPELDGFGLFAAAERLSRFRCAGCGYGASCKIAPERCPMCGGGSWEYENEHRRTDTTSFSTATLNERGRL